MNDIRDNEQVKLHADKLSSSSNSAGQNNKEPIAIVGLGCRFPGGAYNANEFWKILVEGKDAIIETPAYRWSNSRFYSSNPKKPGKTILKQGGFLEEDIRLFDTNVFGISPREAAAMDPQQRILLEVAWQAIEDAGIDIESLSGSDTSVYMGGFTPDSMSLHLSPLNHDLIGSHTGIGSAMTMMSARISHSLNLTGPCMTIDTACSSSLVAFHYACEDIWHKRSQVALAGGASIMLTPAFQVMLSKGGFLAPDGKSKSFSASANGYGRGEGAGVVVLKSLSQAISDGDQIYCIVRNTGTNQDGHTSGITVPSAEAQRKLLLMVTGEVNVNPHSVRYVEAHGTGTKLGDPIEANAIGSVYGVGRDKSNPCLVGSVKANIGHTEAAAGIAGIIKTALCLKYKLIPRQIHTEELNSTIPFEKYGIKIPTENIVIEGSDSRTLAAVNSFGFGGTNAHVLLQSHVNEPIAGESINSGDPRVFPISAQTQRSLGMLTQSYLDMIKDNEELSLDDLAFSMSTRRTHHKYRTAFMCNSLESLTASLRDSLTDVPKPSNLVSIGRDGVTFVYSGMGPQWQEMGVDLFARFEVFRDAAEECDKMFFKHAGWSILDKIYSSIDGGLVSENWLAQPANFLLQVSLTALLKSFGIQANSIVGHSLGEVCAAYTAEAITLSDAALIIYHRSRIQQKISGKGKMLAAGISIKSARSLVEEFEGEVNIAAINGNDSVTLSGENNVIEKIAQHLTNNGVFNRILNVNVAYHSYQMDVLKDEILSSLGGVQATLPKVPLYSTVSGTHDSQLRDAEYWWKNIRNTVLFSATMNELYKDGKQIYVEIGAHPVLMLSIKEMSIKNEMICKHVKIMQREKSSEEVFINAIVELYSYGCKINWSSLFSGQEKAMKLPFYSWDHESYWLESDESKVFRLGRGKNIFLDTKKQGPECGWRVEISDQLMPYINDHKIGGSVVFPGAAYVDACFGVQQEVMEQKGVIEDFQFQKAFLIKSDEKCELGINYSPKEKLISLHSRVGGSEANWSSNATCKLSSADSPLSKSIDVNSLKQRLSCEETSDLLYARFERWGMQYGESFRLIRQLWLGHSEVLAEIESIVNTDDQYSTVHPTVLDASFQTLAAIVSSGAEGKAYMPVRIRSIHYYNSKCVTGKLFVRGTISNASDDYIEGDLAICDSNGNVILDIKGLRCQAVQLSGSNELDVFPVSNWLVQYQWKQDLVKTSLEKYKEDNTVYLIFTNSKDTGFELEKRIEQNGAKCDLFVLDDERKSKDSLYIEGNSAREYVEIFERYKKVTSLKIVFYWAPDGLVEIGSLNSSTSCAKALTLVKGMSKIELTNFSLFICTNNSQITDSSTFNLDKVDFSSVSQAALWGLGRVIMTEHPNFQCRLLDSDLDDFKSIKELIKDIMGESVDEEVVIESAGRFINCLLKPEVSVKSTDVSMENLISTAEPFELSPQRIRSLTDLSFVESKRNDPELGEIEICIKAVGLNFKDILKMQNRLSPGAIENTYCEDSIGMEVAAVVTRIGLGVQKYKVGDEVMGLLRNGGFRSYAIVDVKESLFVPINSSFSYKEMAGVPIVFSTASYCLNELSSLQAGQTILIHSAAGGLGLAAIQIAQNIGATIMATSGSPEKRSYLKSLGVEHVFNSRDLNFAEEVLESTRRKGVDVVLNSLAGEFSSKSLEILSPFGHFIELGKRDISEDNNIRVSMLEENRTFTTVDLDRIAKQKPEIFMRHLRRTMKGITNGELQPIPITSFPISDIKSAFRFMIASKHKGKIVISTENDELTVHKKRNVSLLFEKDKTYIIIGGFGGFGLEVATWMRREGAENLVLIGRRGAVSEKSIDVIENMKKTGANIRCIKLDISSYSDTKKVIEELSRSMPPIDGIFHAAVVLEDDVLLNLNEESLNKVMDPKMKGAWNLHQLTLDMPLKYFVMFSSISALIGNKGQGNYVAANCFLDSLCQFRKTIGKVGVSINWGLLSEVGVAAQNLELQSYLQSMGMKGFTVKEAIFALDFIMRNDFCNIGVADINWSTWFKFNPGLSNSSRFSQLHGVSDNSVPAHIEKLRKDLEKLNLQHQLRKISSLLENIIQKVVRIPKSELSDWDSLLTESIDSLISTELQMEVESEFNISYTSLELIGDASINKMSKAVHKRLKLNTTEIKTAIQPVSMEVSA